MKSRLLGILFTAIVCAINGSGQKAAIKSSEEPVISLKVVSQRVMSEEEGFRKGGLANTDIAVILRLETKKAVEFLSFSDSILPLGFDIEKRDGVNVWRYVGSKGESLTSPGAGHWLDNHKTAEWYSWIELYGNFAIEWEIVRSSKFDAGKKIANSVFLRDRNGKVFEVMTDFYEISMKGP